MMAIFSGRESGKVSYELILFYRFVLTVMISTGQLERSAKVGQTIVNSS